MFDRMTNDFIRRLRFQTKHPYITLTKVISLIQTDTVRNKMHSLHNTIMDHQTVFVALFLQSYQMQVRKRYANLTIQFGSLRSFSFF